MAGLFFRVLLCFGFTIYAGNSTTKNIWMSRTSCKVRTKCTYFSVSSYNIFLKIMVKKRAPFNKVLVLWQTKTKGIKNCNASLGTWDPSRLKLTSVLETVYASRIIVFVSVIIQQISAAHHWNNLQSFNKVKCTLPLLCIIIWLWLELVSKGFSFVQWTF